MARKRKQDRNRKAIDRKPAERSTGDDREAGSDEKNFKDHSEVAERRWKRVGVIGTWVDAAIRFIQVITNIRI